MVSCRAPGSAATSRAARVWLDHLPTWSPPHAAALWVPSPSTFALRASSRGTTHFSKLPKTHDTYETLSFLLHPTSPSGFRFLPQVGSTELFTGSFVWKAPYSGFVITKDIYILSFHSHLVERGEQGILVVFRYRNSFGNCPGTPISLSPWLLILSPMSLPLPKTAK